MAYCFFYAEIEGVGNDSVPNAYLICPREGFHKGVQVAQVQVMSCVQSQSYFVRFLCGGAIVCNGRFGVVVVLFGVRPRVEFHSVSPCAFRIFHHFRVSIHKYADAYLLLVESAYQFRQVCLVFFGVPTVVACQLVGAVGHQRYLCGANIQHQFDKLFGGVALYVQFGFHERTERIHIAATDMPLIGAGMHRNALSAKSFAVGGKTLYIGQIAAACIAQGSHFVYIYAEPCHFLFPLCV